MLRSAGSARRGSKGEVSRCSQLRFQVYGEGEERGEWGSKGERGVREDEVRRSEEKGKKGEGRMKDEVWLFWLENKQDFRSFYACLL